MFWSTSTSSTGEEGVDGMGGGTSRSSLVVAAGFFLNNCEHNILAEEFPGNQTWSYEYGRENLWLF